MSVVGSIPIHFRQLALTAACLWEAGQAG